MTINKAIKVTAIFSLLIIFCCIIFINPIAKLYIGQKIKNLETIKCHELKVDIINGYISAKGVKFKTVNENLTINAQSIKIKGFSIYSFLKNNQILISTLKVQGGKVIFLKEKTSKNLNIPFKQIKIKSIDITNTNVYIKIDSVKQGSLSKLNAKIDSFYIKDSLSKYGAAKYSFNISAINYKSKAVKISTAHTHLSSQDSITIKDVFISTVSEIKDLKSKNELKLDSIKILINKNAKAKIKLF